MITLNRIIGYDSTQVYECHGILNKNYVHLICKVLGLPLVHNSYRLKRLYPSIKIHYARDDKGRFSHAVGFDF